ncbi:MAG: cell division protein FtsQ/DivIB [Moraxellaceae bacterium]|nr:cell division protein FtsQ/DivIB [Moraxellaceae bacterium]
MIETLKQMLFSRPVPDKKISPIKTPKLGKNTILLFVFVLLISVSILMVRGIINKFPVVNVSINSENLNEIQLKQITQAVESQPEGNFFTAELDGIHKEISSLSWVKQVDVIRSWDRGIRIKVLPRKPIARFGSEYLLDAQGQVYVPADGNLAVDIPLVTLQGSPEQAELIMSQMHQVNEWFAPLGLSVEDMILTPRMTWLIKFNSGLRLLVDGENTTQKLLNVSKVLQNQLANKQKKIQSIDLRYKNGFAIAWKS